MATPKTVLTDLFVSGVATTGSIGQLGWNFTNGQGSGTVVRIAGTAAACGYEIECSASNNDRCCLTLGVGEAGGMVSIDEVAAAQFIVSAPFTDTSHARWWGFANTFDLDNATDVLLIGYDTSVSTTHLLTWARVGGVGTAAVSAIAKPANGTPTLFTFQKNDNGSWILMHGTGLTLLANVAAAAVPTTAALNFGVATRTKAAADKEIRIHYAALALTVP